MTEPKNNKKILICGTGAGAGLEATRLLAEMGETNVDIVTDIEDIKERGITIKEPTRNIEPPIPEMPFMPPETRAERRAKARKKKRR